MPKISRVETALRRHVAICLLALVAWCGADMVQARASLPYMPSLAARHAITQLVDDAGLELTLSSWPLPAAAVEDALHKLPHRLDGDLALARAIVETDLESHRRGRVDLTVATRADTLVGYGDDYAPASSLRLRSAAWGDGSGRTPEGRVDGLADAVVVGRLGLRFEADPSPPGLRRGGVRARLDDTSVAVEALGMQLQAGTRQSWWGPGWRSSLILGNNAPSLPSLSVQRAQAGVSQSPWLAWLGPWTAEYFMSQIEGDADPAGTWLIGQRVVARPFSGWEIGLSRTAQWGGQGRLQTARSYWNMLTGQGLNPNTPAGLAQDASNELAGFDVRARCPSGWPCAVYTQWIGEDLAHAFPTHFLTQWGIDWWRGDSRFNLEYADSACDSSLNDSVRMIGCAYSNHLYVNGYASAARWLGASQGPDVRLLSLQWIDMAQATTLRFDYGLMSARPLLAPPFVFVADPAAVAAQPPDGRFMAFTFSRTIASNGATITPTLRWQRSMQPGNHASSLAIGAQWSALTDSRGSPVSTTVLGDHPLQAGLALFALGLVLDDTADRYAQNHGGNNSMLALRRAGDALPVAALALAGTQWMFERGSRRGDTAFAAATAGVTAYAASRLLKTAIDRDRPSSGFGAASFGNDTANPRSASSMPSSHAAMAWAVLTPYAQAYDQPWLYGLAGLTSAGRVMGREHWLSDVVAGSLLGYHLGQYANTRLGASGARLAPWGRGLALTLPLP